MRRDLTRVFIRVAFATTAVLVMAALAGAAIPEAECQRGRYKAAAKYASCEQKVLGKYFVGPSFDISRALSKCGVKYTGTWDKLVASDIGSTTCVGDRFVDNSDGTVTDKLTALQWEQKTDDATVHDKDNVYTWSAGPTGFTAADGAAFTTFLSALNGSCFAGQCDWRLPTVVELQTILSYAYPFPCATNPCIDQVKFGPTAAGFYWSSTTFAPSPSYAWFVIFSNGLVDNYPFKGNSYYVRAVRGGL